MEFFETPNVDIPLINLGYTTVSLAEIVEIYGDHVEDVDVLEWFPLLSQEVLGLLAWDTPCFSVDGIGHERFLSL